MDVFMHSFQGIITGDNKSLLRLWYEVKNESIEMYFNSYEEVKGKSSWLPYNKGGSFRKWYGNNEYIVLWENDGYEIKRNTLKHYPQLSWNNLGWKISNEKY